MTARKPAPWRIFKCQCAPECESWWIGQHDRLAIRGFRSGAEALAAFARGEQ